MLREALQIEPDVNSELALRVKIFLAAQHFAGMRRIRVSTQGDTVILDGRLSSFHERQLAVACCQRVAGVRQVVDRLVVADGDSWDGKSGCPSSWPVYRLTADEGLQQHQYREQTETIGAEEIMAKVVARKSLPSTIIAQSPPAVIMAGVMRSRPK